MRHHYRQTSGRTSQHIALVFALALFLDAAHADAANLYWTTEAPSSGNWTNNANWIGVQPTAADTAYLGAPNVSQPARATNAIAEITELGAICNNLSLGSASGGEGTINMQSGSLQAVNYMFIASLAPGTFNQYGGTVTVHNLDIGRALVSPAAYNMVSGQLLIDELELGIFGHGFVSQSGGSVHVKDVFEIGAYSDVSSAGTYNLTGGSVVLSNGCSFVMGVDLKPVSVLNIGDTNGTGTIVEESGAGIALELGYSSTQERLLRGWGTIALTGNLQNSGRVEADGYGTDRDLDLSTFSGTTGLSDNTTDHGWFAQNHGRLLLPSFPVSSGNTYYWGEEAGPFLVNSLKMLFTAGSGILTGVLYAADHALVPPGIVSAGVWSLDGVSGSAGHLWVRYDDAALAAIGLDEEDLKLWQYNGTQWVELAATVDPGTKRIAGGPYSSLAGFIAVGREPRGTMITIQ